VRPLIVLAAAAAALTTSGTVVIGSLHVDAPARGDPPLPVAARPDPAADVLRAWDRRRAAAYASGSVGALRSLYVARSSAGRADVRVLRGYRTRGLVVRGMRMQVLSLAVLQRDDATWRLRVTDRLTGAVAVRPSRGGEVVLPDDAPSTRTVTLVRGDDGVWRVSEVSSG
jgi:hypothetical protein